MTKNNEEEIIYTRLSSVVGRDMALYCMCAVLDYPYIVDNDAESWADYIKAIDVDGGFAEGETNVNNVLLAGIDQRELWDEIWGAEYNDNDCKRLDELCRLHTGNLAHSGGVDEQQLHTARECAKLELESEKLLRGLSDRSIPVDEKKNYTTVMKDLNKMVADKLKESEMRKTDIPRSAQQRLDGFVKKLEENGLGVDMTQEDVAAWIHKMFTKRKYKHTRDAVDSALLSIHQTMAKNNDMPIPMEIDEDMSLAAFEYEFATEPNERENEVYNYLGIPRGSAGGGKRNGTGEIE